MTRAIAWMRRASFAVSAASALLVAGVAARPSPAVSDAAILQDGVIQKLLVEPAGGVDVSGVNNVIDNL